MNTSDKTPSEDGEPTSVAKRLKNLFEKKKKIIIIGGTALGVVAIALLINHLAKRQYVTEDIETYTPFPDPVPGDQQRQAKCLECETEFDVSEARDQYQSEPGVAEGEYDDLHGGEWCADCAVDRAEGLLNQGRAIFMMNGDEDYDDDFVTNHL